MSKRKRASPSFYHESSTQMQEDVLEPPGDKEECDHESSTQMQEDVLEPPGDKEECDCFEDASSEVDNNVPDSPNHKRTNRKKSKKTIFSIVQDGKLKMFKECSSQVNLITDRDDKGNNYIHRAIKMCLDKTTCILRKHMIKFLILEAPELLITKNEAGETPLFFACKSVSHFCVISQLVKSNPKALNIANKEKITPLHIVASLLGHQKLMGKKTLKDKDFLNQQYNKDDVLKTSLQLCEMFIENGADIKAEDNLNSTVVEHALTQCRRLSDCKTNKEKEVHHFFIENMVDMLLKHGASLRSSSGNHAIRWVYTERQASWILKRDPKALEENEAAGSRTILHHALEYLGGSYEGDKVCHFFIKQGVKLDLDLLSLAREKLCRFSVIQLFLAAFPGYDINTVNDKGENLLIQYGKDCSIIEKLIQLGADVTAVDKYGDSALYTAAKRKDIAAVRLLLNSGADPSKFSSANKCAIFPFCKAICMQTCKVTQYLNIIKDIMEHPQMKVDSSFESVSNVISVVLEHFLRHAQWKVMKTRINVFLKIILTSNESLKEMPNLKLLFPTIAVNNYEITIPHYTILSYILYTYIVTHQYDVIKYDDLNELLDILCRCGLSFKTTSNFTSPLSVVLLLDKFLNDTELLYDTILVQDMNLISNTLQILHREDDMLGYIYKEFMIPDPLFLAHIQGKINLVSKLLQHYWGPPLSLLIFPQKDITANCGIAKSFSMLMKYGGIPHGTDLHKVFQKKFSHMEHHIIANCKAMMSEEFSEQWTNYQNYLTTPLRLQELCKYKVRQCVAKNVVQNGADLSKSLHALLPPLLRDVVIY